MNYELWLILFYYTLNRAKSAVGIIIRVWCNVCKYMQILQSSQWQELLTKHLQMSEKPLIVILGPTASGKTDFSIAVANYLKNAEIINADSRQLYRHLDIGTAKISQGERGNIPHHLLDVLDPKEEVTIAWYKDAAERAIEEIRARKGIPILVGGSMLYVSAVIDGLKPLPEASPELRARLEADYERRGGEALHAQLEELDPASAALIHPRNKPYVIRALEIFETTGKQPSAAKTSEPTSHDLLLLGLSVSRELLTQRILHRTKAMLEGGWISEVQALLLRGYSATDPAMKSHGYREIVSHLKSGVPRREELAELIAKKTRDYAKRQMTWWRGDPRIRWISVS